MSCLSSKRTTPNPALLRDAGGTEPGLDSSGTDETGEAPQLLVFSRADFLEVIESRGEYAEGTGRGFTLAVYIRVWPR